MWSNDREFLRIRAVGWMPDHPHLQGFDSMPRLLETEGIRKIGSSTLRFSASLREASPSLSCGGLEHGSFEGLALFEREAKVLAAPNHPHITPFLPRQDPIRYRCVLVLTNSDFPATAGEAIKPLASVLVARISIVRPGFITRAVPC